MAESSPEVSEIDGGATDVVNSILLWRIYDALIVLITLQDTNAALKLTKLHEEGEFLGPNPSYRPEPTEQFFQPVGEQEEPGK